MVMIGPVVARIDGRDCACRGCGVDGVIAFFSSGAPDRGLGFHPRNLIFAEMDVAVRVGLATEQEDNLLVLITGMGPTKKCWVDRRCIGRNKHLGFFLDLIGPATAASVNPSGSITTAPTASQHHSRQHQFPGVHPRKEF